jgi:hypothetical protein
MVIPKQKLLKRYTETYLNENIGDTKPNVFSNNYLPYYVFEDATVDGIAPTATDDETLVETLLSLIMSGDVVTAAKVIDYIQVNGFNFDRSTYVPGAVTYTTGESPYILLNYAMCLILMYDLVNDITYDTLAQAIYTRLKTNMTIVSDISYPTAAASNFVLLYDVNGLLVTTFRGGTYISDVNPLTWLLLDETTLADNCVQMFMDSQLTTNTVANNGILLPFFVRDLTENSAYPSTNNWSFEGQLTDQLDMNHSYTGILNLTRYLNYRKRFYDGTTDRTSQYIIEKFLKTTKNFYDLNGKLPDTITYSSLLWGDTTTQFIDPVTFNSSYTNLTLSNTREDLEFMAKLGLICLYTYQVNKNTDWLNFGEIILDNLITYQDTDGSINDGTYKYTKINALVVELMNVYNNLDNLTYLEIANQALDIFGYENIYKTTLTAHPQFIVIDFLNEGLKNITSKRLWEWSYDEMKLPFNVTQNDYNLRLYKINPRRIEQVTKTVNNQIRALKKVNEDIYLNNITMDNTAREPQYYCIKNETMYLYPTPDQDYDITACYYWEQNKVETVYSYPYILPKHFNMILKWFVAANLAGIESNFMYQAFEFIFLTILGFMSKSDAKDASSFSKLPSNINWGGN